MRPQYPGLPVVGHPMRTTSSHPLRIGILGCSDIARRRFIPALLASDHAVLAAVAGRDRERAADFVPGESYAVVDYDELVTAPAVDLIYISTPNHLHEEWAVRALEAGKHVICEKPLATSLGSAEKMLSAAEKRGVLLYENLMYLQHPQHAAVKRCIEQGHIGRITGFRTAFGFPVPPAGNFRLDPAMGGGAFHDLNRYPLSAATYFLQGDEYRFYGISSDREQLNLSMHGVAATSADEAFSFSIAFGQQYESYYEIIGELGKIRVDRAYTTPADLANTVLVVRGVEDASFVVPSADHFLLTINHVAELISRSGDFREQHARSLRLARLADAMERGCRHDG